MLTKTNSCYKQLRGPFCACFRSCGWGVFGHNIKCFVTYSGFQYSNTYFDCLISIYLKRYQYENERQKNAPANIFCCFNKFINFDVSITSKMAFCASRNSKYGNLRPLMILLEYSAHGIPWIVVPTIVLFLSHQQHIQEASINLLIGKFVCMIAKLGSFTCSFFRLRA